MQLYADLAVLTARPGWRDTACVPHHLYGMADAAEAWSVGRWLKQAQEALAGIAARGRPAIFTGGTGLYFSALTCGLAEIPTVSAALRDTVTDRFDTQGEAQFRADLGERDPRSAARISPGDRQRLIRAACVLEATGVPLPHWQTGDRATLAPGGWTGVVLEPPREVLYARCDARLQAMADGGALDEAAALLARGLNPALPAMKALGVREFADALQGRLTLAEAVAAAQLQTRRYAKRQSTWFRNQTRDWARIQALDAEADWAALRALISEHPA